MRCSCRRSARGSGWRRSKRSRAAGPSSRRTLAWPGSRWRGSRARSAPRSTPLAGIAPSPRTSPPRTPGSTAAPAPRCSIATGWPRACSGHMRTWWAGRSGPERDRRAAIVRPSVGAHLQALPVMSPSLKNISKRTADKARDAAAGSEVPAGQEAPSPEAAATPATVERGSMRKRARRLGRMREVLLRELGALVVEMRRLERDNPELVARKAAEVLAVDEQLRGLRAALGERQTVDQVVAAGVAGSCARCGTLMATDDRFCSTCGLAVAERVAGAEAAGAVAAAPPAGPGGEAPGKP